MFSPVYVLLPFSEVLPAEAIRASLAPFERGGRGDLPDEWLTFHDETAVVRALHTAEFVFSKAEGGGTRIEGGDTQHLDVQVVKAEMAARDLRRWAVRFADLEPDLDIFAGRFVRGLDRHAITGGYGRWLNPLGRWDWWDLGGRFDGRIVGERRQGVRMASVVSSGPSRGRSILNNVQAGIVSAFGSEPPVEIVVEADNNIELVSRLLDDARAGHEHAIPGAILLPPASITDELRWLRSWPEIGPAATIEHLGLPTGADWREIVIAAYERFPDHWAAGVAFHL